MFGPTCPNSVNLTFWFLVLPWLLVQCLRQVGGGEPAKWFCEAEACAGSKESRREGGRERTDLEEPTAIATQSPVPTVTDCKPLPTDVDRRKRKRSNHRLLGPC